MKQLAILFNTICNGTRYASAVAAETKVIQTATHSGVPELLARSGNMRQKIAQSMNDTKIAGCVDTPSRFYTAIRDKYYEAIRAGKELIYKPRESYNPKEFHSALFAKENNFYGKVEGAWMYRYPSKMTKAKIQDRLSLNVYQDTDLIKKLDTYLSQNCPNAHYKCPGAGTIGWNTRHDTITIYFSEKVSPQMAQDIATLAKPHIRTSADEIMLGKRIAQGVYHVEEPTKESIKPLLIKAKLLNLEPEFYDWLGTPDFINGGGLFEMVNGERVVHTSPGNVAALEKMLDKFKEILT